MSGLFHRLAFHRSGKPRPWVIAVLFRNGTTVRPRLRRVVYKKNGRVRPRFAFWMNASREGTGGPAAHPGEPHPAERVLQSLRSPEEDAKRWHRKAMPDRLLDVTDLNARLAPPETGGGRLALSISHDDAMTIPGGVQLCVQREQRLAAGRGIRYLHLHPYFPIPRLADAAAHPDTLVSLNLDGTAIGACRMSALIDWTAQAAREMASIDVLVHHLRGHLPEQVSALVKATGSRRCVFWVHDFFSMCPNFTLQRNDLAFCGGPPVSSNACMMCVYGRERRTHLTRMQAFFDTLEVAAISPSEVTAAFWADRAGLTPDSLTVVPHVTLDMPARAQPSERPDGPVTVGFLGSAADHKGWPVFVALMQALDDDPDTRFVVLSAKHPQIGETGWRPVHVTAADPAAMSDAVSDENIDLVLHWPSWPETFSFTTFEALAGDAFVVTHAGSGNVAAAVRDTGRGAVLEDTADLRAFFRDGRARALAQRRRETCAATAVVPRHGDLSFALTGRE